MTISLLNDEQMSNKVGVEHQPGKNPYFWTKPEFMIQLFRMFFLFTALSFEMGFAGSKLT